ncbi:MAG: hypothetical protein GTN89_10655 [Acidobacteria bacterium]|nr:hypothetical protein [Acidobacteriota bacterium]NIM62069.1 hypothetical protein [Acidobacteriota bacterium]NIO59718.1 hypothetical protein [Acidobacteriota bacterium]NIQ30807.1 hypothetical protein [Acidobacteriota bacterium]NIQ85869.1 hypothetical protein [Acidobacteriota bacterium]
MRRDDPRLSIRLDDAEEHRPVAVLSRSLELSPDARLFARNDPASVLVFTGPDGSEASARAIEGVATVVRVAEDERGLDLGAVLRELAERGVHSVLVEGGGATLHHFLSQGLAQRAALFQAPLALGARGATAAFDGETVVAPSAGWSLVRETVLPVGPDQLVLGSWVAPDAGA